MADLRAIRGNKPKALAEARILQCPCGSRTVIEARVGVAVDKQGKTIHRGTLVRTCAGCGRVVE
jgi:hypothetical protein